MNQIEYKPVKRLTFDYLSLMEVVCALAVVGLHTNGVFWQFSTARYWLTANIIECVFYFAVPIFFMMTGVTLIDFNKRYGLKTYFRKRFQKVIIPFIFWSLMGLVYRLIIHSIHLRDLSLTYIINGIFSTSFISIYWFFVPLICIYFCIPLFSAVNDDKKLTIFKYVAGIAFLINSLIPFVLRIIWGGTGSYSLNVMVGSNYLIYVLLGYILSRITLTKKLRYKIFALAIAGLLAHIIGTYYLSIHAGKIIDIYKGYLNVPCILYSLGIFVFLKRESDHLMAIKMAASIINFLKPYTFAIYLLQWFFMDILVWHLHVNAYSIIYRLGGIILVTVLCVITTYIIRKLPFGKIILP